MSSRFRRPATLALFGLLALRCTAEGPETGPITPSGPAPEVSASLGFGESPVEGFVYLRPRLETTGWSYQIDVDEDGDVDHEGILQGEIGFSYRFELPGEHSIRVDLTGPDGAHRIEVPVVVNDPEAIRVSMQRQVVEVDPVDTVFFEGITTDHSGSAVYVADYWARKIFRLDAGDLHELISPLELPDGWGVEGMAIPPSDTLLFIAHKVIGLTVVAIPRMEALRNVRAEAEFFVHAVDDTLALMSGHGNFSLIDTRSGTRIRALTIPAAWHFSVSSSASMAAVVNRLSPVAVHVVSLPDLQNVGTIPLSDSLDVESVAFDPAGDRLYVMGGGRFFLLDVASRSVLLSMRLGSAPCSFFCVANPVAVSRSGRFVAMERGDGVTFIDTMLDLPRFHTHAGHSVTASPIEEAFYLLRPDGLVSKIGIQP